jgi:hypothetical protein
VMIESIKATENKTHGRPEAVMSAALPVDPRNQNEGINNFHSTREQRGQS